MILLILKWLSHVYYSEVNFLWGNWIPQLSGAVNKPTPLKINGQKFNPNVVSFVDETFIIMILFSGFGDFEVLPESLRGAIGNPSHSREKDREGEICWRRIHDDDRSLCLHEWEGHTGKVVGTCVVLMHTI